MEIKVGSVVELNEGIFGGMRGVVTEVGDSPLVGPACEVGIIGFPSDLQFICATSEVTVVGEVRG